MKTVLVYKAEDILIRQAVHDRLIENGIQVFGADTSVNVVYPNTPNLYLAGASALFEGYRILVLEEDEKKAKELILELEKEIQESQKNQIQQKFISSGELNPDNKEDYFRRFQLFSLISLVIPLAPIPMALFYFYKTLKGNQSFSIWKVFLHFFILLISIGLSSYYWFIFRTS